MQFSCDDRLNCDGFSLHNLCTCSSSSPTALHFFCCLQHTITTSMYKNGSLFIELSSPMLQIIDSLTLHIIMLIIPTAIGKQNDKINEAKQVLEAGDMITLVFQLLK